MEVGSSALVFFFVVAVFGDFEVVVDEEVAGAESVLDVRRFLAVGGEPAVPAADAVVADAVFLSLLSLLLLPVLLVVAVSFLFF